MYLFNITLLVEEEIHEKIKSWILQDFLPEVAENNIFRSQSLLKVLNSPNEGITYSLQFLAESEAQIAIFQKQHFVTLQKKAQEEHPGKLHYFDSVLEYQ